MYLLHAAFLTLGLAPVTGPADEPRDKAAEELKALQGTWELVQGEVGGRKMTAEELKGAKLVYQGDQYTVRRGTGKNVTGKAKLDPAKDPKKIDITDADGPYEGKVLAGIYALQGDELKECFAPPGMARPTEFSSGADSGNFLHVWKRVKE
jgi:uncharacterized protein (TIGR03067 family)